MNGFREELISSLSGINGDITIFDATDIEIEEIQLKYPEIEIVKNIQERVITSNGSGIEGLLMKSLSNKDLYLIPKINQNLFEVKSDVNEWVYIGVELARSLDVQVGDRLQISIPGSTMTILGPVLNSNELLIKGIFNSGIYDYDKYFIYSNIDQFYSEKNEIIYDLYNTKNINFDDLNLLTYETW